jgi:hypothetical protein
MSADHDWQTVISSQDLTLWFDSQVYRYSVDMEAPSTKYPTQVEAIQLLELGQALPDERHLEKDTVEPLQDTGICNEELQNRISGAAEACTTEKQESNIIELLKQKDHVWSGIVRDFNHYQELARKYKSMNDKRGKTCVPVCKDFPEDKQTQRELVRELFESILDFSDAIDCIRDGSGKTINGDAEECTGLQAGETVHAKRVKALSNLEVELLAWDLLVGASMTLILFLLSDKEREVR